MPYKIKYSKKEKKEQNKIKIARSKSSPSLNQNNEEPTDIWIDAREEYVLI